MKEYLLALDYYNRTPVQGHTGYLYVKKYHGKSLALPCSPSLKKHVYRYLVNIKRTGVYFRWLRDVEAGNTHDMVVTNQPPVELSNGKGGTFWGYYIPPAPYFEDVPHIQEHYALLRRVNAAYCSKL